MWGAGGAAWRVSRARQPEPRGPGRPAGRARLVRADCTTRTCTASQDAHATRCPVLACRRGARQPAGCQVSVRPASHPATVAIRTPRRTQRRQALRPAHHPPRPRHRRRGPACPSRLTSALDGELTDGSRTRPTSPAAPASRRPRFNTVGRLSAGSVCWPSPIRRHISLRRGSRSRNRYRSTG